MFHRSLFLALNILIVAGLRFALAHPAPGDTFNHVYFRSLSKKATASKGKHSKKKREKLAIAPEESHGSYLKLFKEPKREETISEAIFDKNVAKEMLEKYNSINNPYIERRSYQISAYSPYKDRWDQYEQNKGMADWTMKYLLQYHLDQFSNNPEKQKTPERKQIAKTAQAVQKIQNTTVEIAPETKAKFKFDLPNGLVRLGVTSPYIDGFTEYYMTTWSPFGGFRTPTEQVVLGASRDIKSLKASTGVRYGVMTDTISYSASKTLMGGFSAQIDQNQHLKNPGLDETVYRLNFSTLLPY